MFKRIVPHLSPSKPWMAQAITVLVLSLSPTTTLAHPLKLSASLVEYDPKTKALRMECKVFRDDFERSLSRTTLKGIDPSTIKQEEKYGIVESFFKKYYTISHNGKVIPLKLNGTQYIKGHNVLILSFKPKKLHLKKGDELTISNSLFFEDFGYAQTNRVTVRIPPFSLDHNQVATFANYKFSFTL